MNYIVDRIGEVVEAMRESAGGPPYYIYGRKVEVVSRLAAMDKLVNKQYKKYPVIALFLNTEEDVSGPLEQWNLNLAIATLSNKTWYSDERYTRTVKPILAPLYEDFLVKLQQSGLFVWTGGTLKRPPHVRKINLYWGTEDERKNSALAFDDPVDAIEILELKINSTNKPNCLTAQ